MFVSLVRYVALIMFFNFSIFQSQPLCSSYSGLVQWLFAASVTFVVDKTFVIFAIKFNSGHKLSLLENQPISIVKKKSIEFNNVSDKWKIKLNIHKKLQVTFRYRKRKVKERRWHVSDIENILKDHQDLYGANQRELSSLQLETIYIIIKSDNAT